MKVIGDFIGNYRILNVLPLHPIGEFYLVEHTFSTASPTLLLIWPTIELSSEEDRTSFQQKSTNGTIQHGSTRIPILDTGIDNQHPYITTAYSEQTEAVLREHLDFMGQAFQFVNSRYPDDLHMQTETFLRLFTSFPNQQRGSDPSHPDFVATGRQNLVSGYRHLKLWQRILLVLLALALVSWGCFALYTSIPAQAATVAITPMKKTLSQSYQIAVSSGSATANTIQGHTVSFTSQKLTQTVAATGKGHHNATQATGSLTVSNIHLDNPADNLVGPSTLQSQSGVSITTEGNITVSEGATVTVPAQADQTGSGGNISAYDLNFPGEIVDAITKAQIGTATITNPQAFSGGTDAYDFIFVQQTDIDKVTAALSTQVSPNARVKVMQQIHTDEHPVGDIQCTANSSPNHKANDQVNDVTITVSVTCSALVYKTDGMTQFGQGYDVVGAMQIASPVTIDQNSALFSVQINGIWSFQWTPQHRGELLHLIAGKPLSEAQQLLDGRKDIQNFSIADNWFPGNALPTSPTSIKLIISRVNGL